MRAPFVAVVATALTLLMQRMVEDRVRFADTESARLRAWSGPKLRHLFAGYEYAAADLYWLRAVQYYGGQRVFSETGELDLVEPLIENVITLDPRFSIAYQLGGVFLAEPPPLGLGRARDAVRLLDRGVGALPDDWFLWREAALFRFDYLQDGDGAVARLREAAARPGAPYWLTTLAADLATRSNDPEAARGMWESLLNSEFEFVAKNAKRNLLRLDALQAAQIHQRAVDAFVHSRGRPPERWTDLIAAGLMLGIPRDPTDVAFDLRDGRVEISRRSSLWRPAPAGPRR